MPKKPSWTHTGTTPEGIPVYRTQNMDPDTTAPWHEVQITPGTIENRMALYGLATEAEALDHVFWECYATLQADVQDDASVDAMLPPTIKANFERVWGPQKKGLRGRKMTQAEIDDTTRRHNEAYGKLIGLKAPPGSPGRRPQPRGGKASG